MLCGFQTPYLEFVAFTPVLLAVAGEACRPRSAIVSQVTLIGRPPACTVRGVAVASQSNTNRPKVSTVKPCANKTDSVHPSGEYPQRPVLLGAAAAVSPPSDAVEDFNVPARRYLDQAC
jgi:hypothetical protein